MAAISLNKDELFTATGEAIAQLTSLMLSVDENKINIIPYQGSWTAPQLITHVTKSIKAMTNAMLMDSKPAARDAGERIAQLKTIFLDFSKKLNSPDFIVPETGNYERQPTIDKLHEAFHQFKENANSANLTDLVEGLPLGPITKLEILHFTLYHTQRHLQQMKRICEGLKNK